MKILRIEKLVGSRTGFPLQFIVQTNSYPNCVVADVIMIKKKIQNGPLEKEVPLLYHMAYETQPYVKKFLSEIDHVSDCNQSKCTYLWCEPTKRILSHASICTDVECTTCIVIRPLLFLHSTCCTHPNCPLPFCPVVFFFSIH